MDIPIIHWLSRSNTINEKKSVVKLIIILLPHNEVVSQAFTSMSKCCHWKNEAPPQIGFWTSLQLTFLPHSQFNSDQFPDPIYHRTERCYHNKKRAVPSWRKTSTEIEDWFFLQLYQIKVNLKSTMKQSGTRSPETLWNLWKWSWAIWTIFQFGSDLRQGFEEVPSHLHDTMTSLCLPCSACR